MCQGSSEVIFSAQKPWWSSEPTWDMDQVFLILSHTPFYPALQTEPPSTLLPTIVYLQTLFLWSWLPIIIGQIKAIIMKVWMTGAIETFQGVLCIQIHLHGEMGWGNRLTWSEGSPSWIFQKNSSPKTDPILSLDSFVYNSILHRLLNAQTLLGGDSVGQS